MNGYRVSSAAAVLLAALSIFALACGDAPSQGPETAEEPSAASEPCGPQAPRDLAVAGGSNPGTVPGDGSRPPRLCNVHFHRPAEHAGIGACPAVAGDEGSAACAGGEGEPVRAGDEIEVHWVYTSCPAPGDPQGGLADCVCAGSGQAELMVFGRKYVMAGDADPAADRELNEPADDLARYAGSTTGPDWSDGDDDDPRPCSPLGVQWAVDRQCRALSLAALDTWCTSNPWNEGAAHGIRGMVTREDWLAPYDPAER